MLTSDGINHVLPDQEICDVIRGSGSPAEGAAQLTDQVRGVTSSGVAVGSAEWGGDKVYYRVKW